MKPIPCSSSSCTWWCSTISTIVWINRYPNGKGKITFRHRLERNREIASFQIDDFKQKATLKSDVQMNWDNYEIIIDWLPPRVFSSLHKDTHAHTQHASLCKMHKLKVCASSTRINKCCETDTHTCIRLSVCASLKGLVKMLLMTREQHFCPREKRQVRLQIWNDEKGLGKGQPGSQAGRRGEDGCD